MAAKSAEAEVLVAAAAAAGMAAAAAEGVVAAAGLTMGWSAEQRRPPHC